MSLRLLYLVLLSTALAGTFVPMGIFFLQRARRRKPLAYAALLLASWGIAGLFVIWFPTLIKLCLLYLVLSCVVGLFLWGNALKDLMEPAPTDPKPIEKGVNI